MNCELTGKAKEDFMDWYMTKYYMNPTFKKEDKGTSINFFFHFTVIVQRFEIYYKFFAQKRGWYMEVQLDQTSTPKYAFDVVTHQVFGVFEKLDNPDWCLYRDKEAAMLDAIELCNKKYNE